MPKPSGRENGTICTVIRMTVRKYSTLLGIKLGKKDGNWGIFFPEPDRHIFQGGMKQLPAMLQEPGGNIFYPGYLSE